MATIPAYSSCRMANDEAILVAEPSSTIQRQAAMKVKGGWGQNTGVVGHAFSIRTIKEQRKQDVIREMMMPVQEYRPRVASLRTSEFDRQAVHVWEHGEYLGQARIESEDSRGGGSWHQTAYRAAVRIFGAGSYDLRREDDQHEGDHASVDSVPVRASCSIARSL